MSFGLGKSFGRLCKEQAAQEELERADDDDDDSMVDELLECILDLDCDRVAREYTKDVRAAGKKK
jgi:hypothetical protein